MILSEFVAYVDLSPYLKSSGDIAAAGLSVVAPERRSEVARYGLRVVAAGTLSNLMSAAIAGIFLTIH